MINAGNLLGAQPEFSAVTPTCCLSMWPGVPVPQVSIPRKLGRSGIIFYDLASEF